AEGIEESAQAEALSVGGCTEGQGHLYGHPMPAEDFCRLLGNRDHRPVMAGADQPVL
ncbi:MAG: hypothetical protein JOZ42_00285, partial [Acetobacteraceae bacterium]|nr:hypothetical protein [Acetobacteraceae bacterium]